jgi:uncharacterized RDD family membrane protein YckC
MAEEKVDYYKERDVLGQELPDQSARRKGKPGTKTGIDHSGTFKLPSIKVRYFSTLIDILVILGSSLGISSLFELPGEVPAFIRGITFLIVVVLYEPLLISFGCTVGQFVTNIRVRNFNDTGKKLKLHLAILRTIIKATLGWVSLITITFNKNRLAIHDYISNSIVIVPNIRNSQMPKAGKRGNQPVKDRKSGT